MTTFHSLFIASIPFIVLLQSARHHTTPVHIADAESPQQTHRFDSPRDPSFTSPIQHTQPLHTDESPLPMETDHFPKATTEHLRYQRGSPRDRTHDAAHTSPLGSPHLEQDTAHHHQSPLGSTITHDRIPQIMVTKPEQEPLPHLHIPQDHAAEHIPIGYSDAANAELDGARPAFRGEGFAERDATRPALDPMADDDGFEYKSDVYHSKAELEKDHESANYLTRVEDDCGRKIHIFAKSLHALCRPIISEYASKHKCPDLELMLREFDDAYAEPRRKRKGIMSQREEGTQTMDPVTLPPAHGGK